MVYTIPFYAIMGQYAVMGSTRAAMTMEVILSPVPTRITGIALTLCSSTASQLDGCHVDLNKPKCASGRSGQSMFMLQNCRQFVGPQ